MCACMISRACESVRAYRIWQTKYVAYDSILSAWMAERAPRAIYVDSYQVMLSPQGCALDHGLIHAPTIEQMRWRAPCLYECATNTSTRTPKLTQVPLSCFISSDMTLSCVFLSPPSMTSTPFVFYFIPLPARLFPFRDFFISNNKQSRKDTY